MKFIIIVFLILILGTCKNSQSQTLTKEEKEILKLQDERNSEALLNYLTSSDNNIRVKVLYALANIADTNSVYKTENLLAGWYEENNNSELLSAYAFFLGQTPSDKSTVILNSMLNSENENLLNTYPEVINSIGKVGDENDLNSLIQKYSSSVFNDKKIDQAFAMALARFAIRKIRNENSIEALKSLTKKTIDTLTQQNIAFAFWRTADKTLLNSANEEIFALGQSKDAQTRMWAVNAEGKLQDNQMLTVMLESFHSEQDWRVKVNMLNSFLNFKLDSIGVLATQLYSVLGEAISDENEHVSLTGINVVGKLFNDINDSKNETAKSLSKNLKQNFIYSLDSVSTIAWRQKTELANSMSLVFRDESKDALFKVYSNTDNYSLKSAVISAMGNFNDGMIYREVRDTISADVQRYNLIHPNTSGEMIGSKDLAKLYAGFVEMLSKLDEKVDADSQNMIRLMYTEFSSSKDAILADLSLNALKDSLYIKYRSETASVMSFDYNELEYPKDLDVILVFIDAMKDLHDETTISSLKKNLNSENYEIAKASADALEKIEGNKFEYSAKPKYDFDWDYIGELSQKEFVTVKTNKGNIRIKLFPGVAPFTVMNFLKLAQTNFYDGTSFHRVVDNFVIQGGDPTGTGYGGPGYSIRSEFSPLTYGTGIVGMASSGKDTEGSQFFITHSETPHLDGKYTIFGEVIDGMDIVDSIMVGDLIEDITIE